MNGTTEEKKKEMETVLPKKNCIFMQFHSHAHILIEFYLMMRKRRSKLRLASALCFNHCGTGYLVLSLHRLNKLAKNWKTAKKIETEANNC